MAHLETLRTVKLYAIDPPDVARPATMPRPGCAGAKNPPTSVGCRRIMCHMALSRFIAPIMCWWRPPRKWRFSLESEGPSRAGKRMLPRVGFRRRIRLIEAAVGSPAGVVKIVLGLAELIANARHETSGLSSGGISRTTPQNE